MGPSLTTREKVTLGAITAGALIFLVATDKGEPARGEHPTTTSAPTMECGYEDVLAFSLKEDAYDLSAGYTICIHIDQVRDTPTP